MDNFDNTIYITEDKNVLIKALIQFQNIQLKKNIEQFLKK